jgi:hypothetical protein
LTYGRIKWPSLSVNLIMAIIFKFPVIQQNKKTVLAGDAASIMQCIRIVI